MKSKFIFVKLLTDAGFVVALFTAIFYLLGIVYFDAYLGCLGFDFGALPVTSKMVLAYGFSILLTSALEIAKYLLFYFVGVGLSYFLSKMLVRLKLVYLLIDKIKSCNIINQFCSSPASDKFETFLKICMLVTNTMLVLTFLIIYTSGKGKKDAQLQIARMKLTPGKTAVFFKDRSVEIGYLLRSSETRFLFYSNDGSVKLCQFQDVIRITQEQNMPAASR